VEWLKVKALSSNPSTAKKEKKEIKKSVCTRYIINETAGIRYIFKNPKLPKKI
jgi:hypothetical protein